MSRNVSSLLADILKDIRVELSDEFDKNFERQAFFNERWQRRKSPLRGDGSLLIQTGQLRRSIRTTVTQDSITFSSTLPYAGIHNDGGEIVVTERMKRYFWYRCLSARVALDVHGEASSGATSATPD